MEVSVLLTLICKTGMEVRYYVWQVDRAGSKNSKTSPMFTRNFIITKHISTYLITQSIHILTELNHLDYNNPHVLTAHGTFLLRQILPLPLHLLGYRLRILKLGGRA